MKHLALFLVIFCIYNLQESYARQCYYCKGNTDSVCANHPEETESETNCVDRQCFSIFFKDGDEYVVQRSCASAHEGSTPCKDFEEQGTKFPVCVDCDTDNCNGDPDFYKDPV